ncbi:hypothetical protein C4D60_Mb08t26480 [Musa balbisiana]|uniref:Uncharacterized protein n=1 Tax=Musa balbisiana TaxID=52838 RepID=A0A4S8K6P9_MUSBA|nr:hypothetical protein C4D60_Mb08t26480 [Musa balbisiana]
MWGVSRGYSRETTAVVGSRSVGRTFRVGSRKAPPEKDIGSVFTSLHQILAGPLPKRVSDAPSLQVLILSVR